MRNSANTNISKLNVADSHDTFHIVLPQRSKLAQSFDKDIGAKQVMAVACIIPPCIGSSV